MNQEEVVKEELSGARAKSYVSSLCRYHRIQASPMFHEAACYVVSELKRMGLQGVEILQFPADGKKRYWTHRTSPGWEVRSAELRLVKPKERILATFDEVPMSLHTFSAATPKDGVEAELVDIGSGLADEDYKGKKVRGKIVLATGGARSVHKEAVVKRGAAGVITDTLAYEFPKVRESLDIPDAHSYQGIWPTSDNAKKIKFGFSISKRQGSELREYLKDKKKIVLRARVDARIQPSKYDIVTATIRGSTHSDEEVFLIAHLCHPKPGANDNASGSGLLMEIARTISSSIKSGKLRRPARTMRFFWVPETTGTVAMLATRPDIAERLVAGVNLDMVGEDQEVCRSTLEISMTPDSLPSYLNDLVMSVAERSGRVMDPAVQIGLGSTFRLRSTPFSLGSDHAEFVEPSTGVPCTSMTQWPDKFYHTSMDTIDKVSEVSLRRVGWIAAVTALDLAYADEAAALAIASLTCSRGLARIAQAGEKAAAELFAAKQVGTKGEPGKLADIARFHSNRIAHVTAREQQAVRSVRDLSDSSDLDDFIEQQAGILADAGRRERDRFDMTILAIRSALGAQIARYVPTDAEREARGLIPKRLFKGTLDWTLLRDSLGEKGFKAYKTIEEKDSKFMSKTAEIVFLINGKRSVADIVMEVAAECGPTDHSHVLKYLRDLERIKLVSF